MVRGGKGMGIDDVRIGNSEGAALPKVARILIADDHALVREGLRTMLSGEDGIEVIAEANDGQQALNICRELEPDLVLMDVRMPEMDGLQATKKIKQEMPKTSVMMVTMHENSDYLFEAVKAGPAGYVLKDTSGEKLSGAVRRTLEGESPLNQELAMRLLLRLSRESGGSSGEGTGGGSRERSGRASPGASGTTPEEGPREEGEPLASHPVATGPETSQPDATHTGAHQAGSSGSGQSRGTEQMESLTPREVEVLRLFSQGQTNPQIAQNLLVSRGTVKIHVQHIISKLGVSYRTQAAVRAIEAGLLGAGTRR
jgi:DNA-binding NarL/FixJ family response regulator